MASPQAQLFCCAATRADPRRAFQPPLWTWLCLGRAALGLFGVAGLKALCGHRRRPTATRTLRAAALASNCLGTAGSLARSVLWLVVPPGPGVASLLCVGISTIYSVLLGSASRSLSSRYSRADVS